jgi:hypothetical protein
VIGTHVGVEPPCCDSSELLFLQSVYFQNRLVGQDEERRLLWEAEL